MSHKLRDTATALLFLAVLISGILYLAVGFYGQRYLEGAEFLPSSKDMVLTRSRRVKTKPLLRQKRAALDAARLAAEAAGRLSAADESVEKALTDTLDRDHFFIESYGLVQGLLGRRVMEDVDPQYTVVRLSDGALSFADPDAAYSDPAEHAEAVSAFQTALEEELGIPLLYIQAPQKVSVYGDSTLPAGLYDYGDSHVNMLLRALRSLGVDTLDLRPALARTGRYDELFFRTDHHWTAEGAFIGWQATADKLEKDYGFRFSPSFTDPERWQRTVYEGLFLGSQGKRVGAIYAGADDLEAWAPRWETSFEYVVPIQSYDRTGSFETALLFPERLENGDLYETNPYTYYSGGDYPFARMKNLDRPDGPTVVLLRDSFGCAFAPFMAMGFGELVTIDLRYFHDDLMNYIKWVEADMVVMLYSPGSIKLDSMFDFFYQPIQDQLLYRRPLPDLPQVEKPVPGAGGNTAGQGSFDPSSGKEASP